ncbi:hypothetical protein Tco_0888192 [Tanacetum coccineum]
MEEGEAYEFAVGEAYDRPDLGGDVCGDIFEETCGVRSVASCRARWGLNAERGVLERLYGRSIRTLTVSLKSLTHTLEYHTPRDNTFSEREAEECAGGAGLLYSEDEEVMNFVKL